MNKSTLSQYGWVVIIIIILVILMGFAAPFGNFVADYTFDALDSIGEPVRSSAIFPTNYSAADIESNERLFGIGKTKSEYVVAEFNDDFTSVTIYKNGFASDGLMKDWKHDESSCFTEHQTTLKTVNISRGVVSIGNYAFNNCTTLSQISFPLTLHNIEKFAFKSCTALKDITIPANVKVLNDGAFSSCTGLENLNIENGVKTIGTETFFACRKLTTVKIPKSITSIGKRAFYYCTSLTEITVDINNPNYSSLNGVLFNKDKTILIQYPVNGPETVYSIPNSVAEISSHAFAYSWKLINVSVPGNVSTINEYAFAYCDDLENVVINSGVKTIKNNAFYDCDALISVVIPNSVELIGDSAFSGMAPNSNIYCQSQETANLLVSDFNYTNSETTVLIDASKF